MGKTRYQKIWEVGREKWLKPVKENRLVAYYLACRTEVKIDGSGIKQLEAHEGMLN